MLFRSSPVSEIVLCFRAANTLRAMSNINTHDHATSDDIEKQNNLITPDPHIHDGHWDILPGDPLKNHHLRNLHIFQDLVGIRTHAHILRPGLSTAESRTFRADTLDAEGGIKGKKLDDRLFARPKRMPFWKLFYNPSPGNGGYYRRAMDEQQSASYWYYVSTTFITLIYVVQILTAATITGLASYEGHRVVLTVLGAINTVLAGLMAYLKGQGLPNRLLKSRDQFSKVMQYTEYKERQFSHYVTMLPKLKDVMDPYQEADRVQDLFLAAKKDQQDNYPDTYLNNNERQAVTNIQTKTEAGFTDAEMTALVEHGNKLKTERGRQHTDVAGAGH